MSSDPSPPSASPPPVPGLPPVQPPSGRQILQLFVVPALIVLVLVGIFLAGPSLLSGVNWIFGRASADSRTTDQFLRDLDNPNAEVRYRAASDLAQVLLRKDELASDPEFALGLSERLKNTLDQSAEAEKSFATKFDGLTEGERLRELKKLDADRNFILYLTGCLGHVMIPTGASLLGQMATQTTGMEPEALASRRAGALFALATLGDKLRKYDKLPDEQKDQIEEKLAESKSNPHARAALEHLRGRRAGKPNTMGVAAVLDTTAADEDPYLRLLTALASTYWHGDAREEKTIEDLLVALSNDAGVGWEKYQERLSRNPDSKRSRPVTKRKGYNAQVNATLALARRGSPRVRMELLEEMLDPEKLGELFVIEQQAVPAKTKTFLFWSWTDPGVPAEKPDESLVVLTVLEALKAIIELHAQRPQTDLTKLMPLIETLETSDNVAVATQAKQTRLALTK